MTVKLEVGQKAPDFDLPRAGGGRISLADLRGAPAVIWFYPAANTPLCTRQACDLRDSFVGLDAAGVRVVGISPDPVADIERFVSEQQLPFDMASDEDHAVMEAYGAWGEKNMYGKLTMGVIRSSFVIDEHGTLTNVRYRVGTPRHAEWVASAVGLTPGGDR
ncbi:MAG: thioredoxin-dependent thiol peroxidase [Dermabacter sp.]|nr:thioredoxin-dependent thiol peroxidase [Dermabacter sp.]